MSALLSEADIKLNLAKRSANDPKRTSAIEDQESVGANFSKSVPQGSSGIISTSVGSQRYTVATQTAHTTTANAIQLRGGRIFRRSQNCTAVPPSRACSVAVHGILVPGAPLYAFVLRFQECHDIDHLRDGHDVAVDRHVGLAVLCYRLLEGISRPGYQYPVYSY